MSRTRTGGLAARPWVVLLCGAAIVTLAMGIRQSFGLFMRPMSLDIGVGREAFGLAIAVQNLVLGLAQPFVGALADRHGAGRVAALGGLLYAAGLGIAAAAGGAAGLHLGIGFVVGLAMTGTTFVVVLGAVGRAVPPERRSLAFGITTAGGSFGQFLVVPVMQAMIDGFGWREALVVTAVVVLSTALFAVGIAGRPSASPTEGRALSLREALGEAARHRGYWLLNAGFFVCGFHVAFISTHLPAFLTDNGLDPATGARALALVGLFNIFGSYAFGVLGDRYRKTYLLSALYLGRGVVIALFLALPLTATTALVFASAMGFLWLGTVPLTSGLVGQIFGVRYLSTLFGIVFLSHQVGAFFGAWAAGLVFDRTGSYDLVWQVSILLAVLAGALNWPIRDAPVLRPAEGAAA